LPGSVSERCVHPPFSRGGTGFDVEVARRFATEHGLDVVWVPFRWPELAAAVEAGVFDVAMSGVTWRPERAVVGYMSRAVAVGGPCVVGEAEPRRVAVNRGGILERFTRERFAAAEVRAVDDNLALPGLLEHGEVDAFVTDSFELVHFLEEPWPVDCAPAVDRKVYWVAPQRAADLGPVLDAWLAKSEGELDELRRRFFDRSAPRDDLDHLVDLLARRLALMPMVAAWKRQQGRPLVDRDREARVLEHAAAAAVAAELEPGPVVELFAVQIALAKAIQERTEEAAATLDVESQIRPALLRLGERIIDALGAAVPLASDALDTGRLAPLVPFLSAAEIDRLRDALLAVRPASGRQVRSGGPAAG
jgi:chorismate mutase